jgi:hypothetical protein
MTPGRLFAVNAPRGLSVAPDGSELYVVSETDQRLEVWNLNTGARAQMVSLGNRGFGLAASANRIAVSIRLGAVRLYDRATRNFQQEISVKGLPSRLAWNGAGTTLVVPNDSGWVDFIQ